MPLPLMFFHNAHAKQHGRLFANEPANAAQHRLVAMAADRAMKRLRADLFAEADDEHLEQATAERRAEVRVQLHAVDGHDGVGR
jgi:hypothetical protein